MNHNKALTPTVEGNYENDQYVFFWNGPFSNWYPAKFVIAYNDAEIKFTSSEQAMMYTKAWFFKDYEIAEKIMLSNDPREQKALGREVKNFDKVLWETSAVSIVKSLLVHKFQQNPRLLKILLDTGDKTIVEASPYDEIWGIKMGVDDPNILDESKWKGKNFLGKALMKARKELSYET